ncbi:MAG: RNA 2',3'-cyclic phosphodiesterase [Bacteroidetes bacterium]|nr:MAG: RNA 2',3'-cyclic phosphodiesterase [Bacteroidota bacterium]REK04863.1 MAG: RNA 2',3'-cyclic phosphodiesterase [Bacteroidota bacterium]REK36335.1 MAG: RNA 2',3'-cyclic phosphodiesterase [Bacteroidota bacterium]REK50999.1 MAG: RNA 2',3'-cyclic phosphodiesterase [Bacteroidota bacterium]
MVRLFAAFPFPQADQCLSFIQKNELTEKGWRITFSENLHVTLFFIGEIEEENLRNIQSAIEIAISGQKKFMLVSDGVQYAGKPSKPSMIWLKMKASDEFSKLNKKLHEASMPFMTVKPTHDDPVPHVTLARAGKKSERVKLNTETMDEEFLIDRAELWQTIQTKKGVRYRRLKSWELF